MTPTLDVAPRAALGVLLGAALLFCVPTASAQEVPEETGPDPAEATDSVPSPDAAQQEEEEKRIVFQESQFIEVELTSKKSFFTIPNVLLQLDIYYKIPVPPPELV